MLLSYIKGKFLYYQVYKKKMGVFFLSGVGSINTALSRNSARFTMSKNSDLVNKVLPHFDIYKLQGNKLTNYLIFREILLLINSKAHLTPEGFKKK